MTAHQGHGAAAAGSRGINLVDLSALRLDTVHPGACKHHQSNSRAVQILNYAIVLPWGCQQPTTSRTVEVLYLLIRESLDLALQGTASG
jgi:hypothetical protein